MEKIAIIDLSIFAAYLGSVQEKHSHCFYRKLFRNRKPSLEIMDLAEDWNMEWKDTRSYSF